MNESSVATATPLLEMRGVVKSFPGVQALRGVDLDGRPIALRSPQESRAAGVAVIHQEVNLVPGLTPSRTSSWGSP